jgi:tetratricopeptide (TPR) repeat protein
VRRRIDEISRELGVDYVLEGSARREGSRVRISATLIDARDHTQRWTETFERELAGILVLQSDIARGVAGSLALTLLPAEEARFAGARRVDPEAYEAYLNGRFHANKMTPPDLDAALQYFELALQKDPNYAQAYAGIGLVWGFRNQMGFVPPTIAIPRVKAAALKALELDKTLAAAHHALALRAWHEWDWKGVETESLRAIELDPSDPDPRAAHMWSLMVLNRPVEARGEIERALQLDPLNALFQGFYGMNLRRAGRHDEAIVQLQNALKTSPGLPFAHCGLWWSLRDLDRHADALTEARECYAKYGERVADALSLGYRKLATLPPCAALRIRWRQDSAECISRRSMWSGRILKRANRDRTLEWLMKAVEVRDPNMNAMVTDPQFDGLRGDARFQELLRRVNLPS